jgi:hypothetical protein
VSYDWRNVSSGFEISESSVRFEHQRFSTAPFQMYSISIKDARSSGASKASFKIIWGILKETRREGSNASHY